MFGGEICLALYRYAFSRRDPPSPQAAIRAPRCVRARALSSELLHPNPQVGATILPQNSRGVGVMIAGPRVSESAVDSDIDRAGEGGVDRAAVGSGG